MRFYDPQVGEILKSEVLENIIFENIRGNIKYTPVKIFRVDNMNIDMEIAQKYARQFNNKHFLYQKILCRLPSLFYCY